MEEAETVAAGEEDKAAGMASILGRRLASHSGMDEISGGGTG